MQVWRDVLIHNLRHPGLEPGPATPRVVV